MRRAFRLALRLCLLIGLAMAVVALVRRRSSDIGLDDGPAPWGPRPAPEPAPIAAWVEPVDKACPPTHPVKAKLSSKIFHVPGGANYERTSPDRCYRDGAAAEADGFVRSKR
jgi:hypothetical protein